MDRVPVVVEVCDARTGDGMYLLPPATRISGHHPLLIGEVVCQDVAGYGSGDGPVGEHVGFTAFCGAAAYCKVCR